MVYLILAMLLAYVKAGVIDTMPKCVTVRNTNYEEVELISGFHNPYQMAIDYDTNTIFFSYSTNRDATTFEIAYMNLKTNEHGIVKRINGGFANSVNSQSHKVYMGGNDGLYTFDYNTKSATNINGATNESIWQMFYKDGLYFTTFPHEKALLYKNNMVKEIPELQGKVALIAVKNNGNYVFYNSSGLFTYDKVLGKAELITDHIVNGITADINGNIYFTSPSAIYYIDEKNNKIENIFTSNDDVYGVVVESNGNIIYAKEDSVARLTPTQKECLNNTNGEPIVWLRSLL